MDQKQLAYFVSVAKYRNFSRAAQDFYLTQPTRSKCWKRNWIRCFLSGIPKESL